MNAELVACAKPWAMKTCAVERHNCMEDSGISAWGKLVVVLCTKLVRQSVVPGRACLGASPDCRTLKMYGVGHEQGKDLQPVWAYSG